MLEFWHFTFWEFLQLQRSFNSTFRWLDDSLQDTLLYLEKIAALMYFFIVFKLLSKIEHGLVEEEIEGLELSWEVFNVFKLGVIIVQTKPISYLLRCFCHFQSAGALLD
jgi:hypothetical protein